MINLNEYDIIQESFTRGTWVDPTYKRLYSTDIRYKPFSSVLKKYNPTSKQNEYYLILLDKMHPDIACNGVKQKDGITKIDIPCWNETNLRYVTSKAKISIEQVDAQDGADIYILDI